jgi:hypothetical protein
MTARRRVVFMHLVTRAIKLNTLRASVLTLTRSDPSVEKQR